MGRKKLEWWRSQNLFNIVDSISNGKTNAYTIAQEMGLQFTNVKLYMKNLIRDGVVNEIEKEDGKKEYKLNYKKVNEDCFNIKFDAEKKQNFVTKIKLVVENESN